MHMYQSLRPARHVTCFLPAHAGKRQLIFDSSVLTRRWRVGESPSACATVRGAALPACAVDPPTRSPESPPLGGSRCHSPSERPQAPSETARSCFLAPGPATRKPRTRPNQREKPKTALTAARGFCKLRKSWSKAHFRSETKPGRRRSAPGPENQIPIPNRVGAAVAFQL